MKNSILTLTALILLSASIQAAWTCKNICDKTAASLPDDQKRMALSGGWNDKGWAEHQCGIDNVKEIKLRPRRGGEE